MSELTTALRPKSFDEMIGADELVKRIRHRFESGRMPKAIMFCGQTGGGKTTLARILARALQCTHGKRFGAWCSHCWKHRRDFDIVETNAARKRKVEEIEAVVDSYVISPLPGSQYRVYILDEAHMLSDHAQNLLLGPTEDCPDTTKFILNTTREDKIIPTLRGRCKTYVVPSLDMQGIRRLVRRALRKAHSDLDSVDLSEKLMEKDITSPRLIVKAVESYIDGQDPENAAEVETASEIKTKRLCREAINGDWNAVAHQLRKMHPEDVYAIQGSVCRYLFAIIQGEAGFSSKADVAAKSITRLSKISGYTDKVAMSAMGAALYDVCHYFKKYSR